MNILYIGDIMAQPGIEVVERLLPDLRREFAVDFVIAQGENVTEAKGMSPEDFAQLRAIGIDFFTGGNHTAYRPELIGHLNDPNQPVIRPANYPTDTPGLGWKYAKTPKGNVLVVSLLGQIVGKDADKPVDNPLKCIDEILETQQEVPRVATIVNLHGDFSSEKVVIGYYLDGRVTAVIGDHWHVPTADAMVLPRGTAHITDVGMCGILHSSLGVKTGNIISRWRDGKIVRNELESSGPRQFNAVLVTSDNSSSLANGIQHIQRIID
jgi:metallophosphoesterase (TIGR00282 family)